MSSNTHTDAATNRLRVAAELLTTDSEGTGTEPTLVLPKGTELTPVPPKGMEPTPVPPKGMELTPVPSKRTEPTPKGTGKEPTPVPRQHNGGQGMDSNAHGSQCSG